MKSMMTFEQVEKLILAGKYLFLAASETQLARLPKGNWIAGTIPYFMTESGGIVSHELIQVTELPICVTNIKIKKYTHIEIKSLPKNYYQNGLSFIVIPAFSKVHQIFAKDCSQWENIFNQPLTGWVAGVDLKQTSDSPKVFNGETLEALTDEALVMHIELPTSYIAKANIINIFEQSRGDVITFDKSGFDVESALVNNQKVNFANYLKDKSVDLQCPLVANYMGAMINVSFRDIDSVNNKVRLYAPVFPGVEYRLANPVINYEAQFEAAIEKQNIKNPLFSCNCILNFLYAKLEGKKLGQFSSAMTFGEIAYMLLNQTLVYVTIEKT